MQDGFNMLHAKVKILKIFTLFFTSFLPYRRQASPQQLQVLEYLR